MPVTITSRIGLRTRVGYSASVVIEVERAENVLMVPVAVVKQGGRSFVTVLRAGQRVPVEVVTGITDGLMVRLFRDSILRMKSWASTGMYNSSRSSSPAFGMSGIRIGGFGR